MPVAAWQAAQDTGAGPWKAKIGNYYAPHGVRRRRLGVTLVPCTSACHLGVRLLALESAGAYASRLHQSICRAMLIEDSRLANEARPRNDRGVPSATDGDPHP